MYMDMRVRGGCACFEKGQVAARVRTVYMYVRVRGGCTCFEKGAVAARADVRVCHARERRMHTDAPACSRRVGLPHLSMRVWVWPRSNSCAAGTSDSQVSKG